MIYCLTEGSYSDYAIIGMYEGPAGVDFNVLVEEYKRLYPEEIGHFEGGAAWFKYPERLHAFVAERIGLRQVDFTELHLDTDLYEVRSCPD